MRITIAQLNPTVGDLEGNLERIRRAISVAQEHAADLLITPEMGVLGYPPRDLLFREDVVEAAERAVAQLAQAAQGITVLVGHPRRSLRTVRTIHNAVSVLRDGEIIAGYDKRLLPGYDIFDEDRYFDEGGKPCVIDVAGNRLGILVCEDLWQAGDVFTNRSYHTDPVRETVDAGAESLIVLSASPFIIGKHQRHEALLRMQAQRLQVPIVMVNQVGGNDDLIFDGRSMAVDAQGQTTFSGAGWREVIETIEVSVTKEDRETPPTTVNAAQAVAAIEQETAWSSCDDASCEETYQALVLGIQDYARKTSHQKAVVALSGGIDSGLTVALAVAALGSENVSGITMPSRYSSTGSVEDALESARNLRLHACETIEIESAHETIRTLVKPMLGEKLEGVTDENIQARLRGLIAMSRANAKSALLLATGNKSELAVGYATLYGDMAGALAVLGDLVKSRVYALSRWINQHHQELGFSALPIPVSTIEKPPSAELRPNQFDTDSLPPYEVLDDIIHRYIEREQSMASIIKETGYEAALVNRFCRLIDRNEFKRDQAALILKLTARTFGRGRPMPLAMHWREL